ncbi:MAG: riboflavin synthase [Byssovorax sp.]
MSAPAGAASAAMFTGLVETIGILRRRTGRPGARALIEASLGPLVLGESISVNGACLTVDRIAPGGFECDMSAETLDRTTLGALPLGSELHLERAVPLGGRMGGHMVLGHVDGVGRVTGRDPTGDALRFEVTVGGELRPFLAGKGSVCIDGVSLTVNHVRDAGSELAFDVMLVPHTLGRTLLGKAARGAQVNIEVDVLARYVARILDVRGRASASAEGPAPPAAEQDSPDDPDQRILAKLRSGGYL